MAPSQSSLSTSVTPGPKTAAKVSIVIWGISLTISAGIGVLGSWGHESPNAVALYLPV